MYEQWQCPQSPPSALAPSADALNLRSLEPGHFLYRKFPNSESHSPYPFPTPSLLLLIPILLLSSLCLLWLICFSVWSTSFGLTYLEGLCVPCCTRGQGREYDGQVSPDSGLKGQACPRAAGIQCGDHNDRVVLGRVERVCACRVRRQHLGE